MLICAGWRDGYRTAALRMARELEAPWQLLAGPWAHKLPDRGIPGPRYPFLAEMARFFHRHLDERPWPTTAPERPRSVFFIGSPDSPVRPHAGGVGRVARARSAGPRACETHDAHAGRAGGGARPA